MSLFEFLMVLVSIIIGLGITEILNGIARCIRCRESIQGYWVHAVLVLAVFVALLQQWWEIWGVRSAPEWTFVSLVMMLSGPVGLYLMAHLLFPEPIRGARFREYYYGAMRPVWWLAAATVVAATLFRPIAVQDELLSASNATSFVGLFAFVTLAMSRRPIIHYVLVPAFLLLLLLDIVQWSFVMSEG